MFDKLKRIFIIEEEGSKKTTSVPTKSEVKKDEVPSSMPANKEVKDAEVSSGTPQAKFTNILFGALEANDLEGFDYLEYKESLRSLAKMDMDEPTKYKSAFAMAQTMGATPKLLIDSAIHYKNILAKEEAKFAQALENQRSKQIDDQKNRLGQLQKGIEMKKNKVLELQKQIEADEQALVKAKKGLEGAATKINNTKANFVASFNQIAGQLDADIEKIKTYLK